MKIALLVLLGLLLGALGGAALGVGAGIAWVEIFKTSNFEGYSGMLVFFGFLPAGAVLGALANERQFDEIEALIDDDIDWNLHGPVELFPFFGARHGKAAVLQVIRQIADRVRVHRFDREQIMLGPEQACSMLHYTLTMLDTNKPLRVRLAHFAQFRDGRLARMRILVDSYELAEQAALLPPVRMVAVSA